MKCPNLQKSVKWCEGTNNLPGMRRRVFYTSKNNILGWPSLPRDDLGNVTSPVLQGNFTLAADTYFFAIDLEVLSSGFTSEPQGEHPSQTQLNKLNGVHSGTGSDASALALYLNNNDNVFIFQDMSGKYRVIGNELYPTKCTVSQDLGQGPTSKASTTINVEATDLVPAPFYNGLVVTEDGSFMADGSAVEEEEEEEEQHT